MRVGSPATRGVGTAGVLFAGMVALGACSSEYVSPTGQTPSYSGPAIASNAAQACSRFYALDLYLLTTARDAMTGPKRVQVRAVANLRDLTQRLSSSVESAVTIGDLPRATEGAAAGIVRVVSKLAGPKARISDLSPRMEARIQRHAAVIETACTSAGRPPPESNLEARTAKQSSG